VLNGQEIYEDILNIVEKAKVEIAAMPACM
jgi:hypothetical protein